MTAPVFLIRCPRCFSLHPWREAVNPLPAHRVQAHRCPHGVACVCDCLHHEPKTRDVDGRLEFVQCSDACAIVAKCQACEVARAQVYAQPIKRPECIVCREIKRQGGSECPLVKRTTTNGWAHVSVSGRCKYPALERPPPWCAGATEDERSAFISALPGEAREKAIEAARKANKQEGAEQKTEAPKVKKKQDKGGQTSLF